MDTIQEIRAEVRELLSDTLVVAGKLERDKNESDHDLIAYELGKASALRSVLALIGKVE